jgi:flagellar FliL protein
MKADPKADAAPPKSSKMLIIIIAAVVLLGGGGAGAFFMMSGKSEAKQESKKPVKPEYVALDPFTVNLQPENGEQYLQIAMTLQTTSLEQVTLIKDNMARVRSRILLLLSTKKASELMTPEGKAKLASDIIAEVKQPFVPKADPQDVTDVLFTSFIIQ